MSSSGEGAAICWDSCECTQRYLALFGYRNLYDSSDHEILLTERKREKKYYLTDMRREILLTVVQYTIVVGAASSFPSFSHLFMYVYFMNQLDFIAHS